MKLLDWLDRHPVAVLLICWAALAGALVGWDLTNSGGLLLGAAGPHKRVELYGELAAIAVALLAAVLTVLAILFALPDRARVEELRSTDGWRLLQGSLVAAAFLCLNTVVFGVLGSAIDGAKVRREWLEQLVFASATLALCAIVLGGGGFALVLRALRAPPDPAVGRGEGG
jgi:hypothetical protein